ncbi:hypothetical protein Tco_0025495 [Tanacetum coccineum]
MSADLQYYSSVHSEATVGSIPSEDPYEEAARQLAVITRLTRRLGKDYTYYPRPGCEVGESSAAAAARQPGPTMAHRVDYSLVDTMENQKDRAAVRAEIEVLRRERLAYEQESMETRQALARSEAHCRTLEARVTVLETEVRRHEWQRQAADDLAVRHIMRT